MQDKEDIKKLVEAGVFKKPFRVNALLVYYNDLLKSGVQSTTAMHDTCNAFGIKSHNTFYRILKKRGR